MKIDNELRTYKKIGEELKQEIQSGKFRIGDRLPPERDIAEQFGVSRTVIREALIMLEIEGLVEVKKVLAFMLSIFHQSPLKIEKSLTVLAYLNSFRLDNYSKAELQNLQRFRPHAMTFWH